MQFESSDLTILDKKKQNFILESRFSPTTSKCLPLNTKMEIPDQRPQSLLLDQAPYKALVMRKVSLAIWGGWTNPYAKRPFFKSHVYVNAERHRWIPALESLTRDRLRQQKSTHYSVCVTQWGSLGLQKICLPLPYQGEWELRGTGKEI